MGLDSRTRRGEESRENKTSKSGTGARVPRRGRWGAEKLGEGMGVVVARRPRLVGAASRIYTGGLFVGKIDPILPCLLGGAIV